MKTRRFVLKISISNGHFYKRCSVPIMLPIIIALTLLCLAASCLLSRFVVSSSSASVASRFVKEWTAVFTAGTSLLYVFWPEDWMARVVVGIPLISFAVEIGLWQREGKDALFHHVFGIIGCWFFWSGRYLCVIAYLLIDSWTYTLEVKILHWRPSRSYYCFWLLVRCFYYPAVLIWFIWDAYTREDLSVCACLIVWFVFSSFHHAKLVGSMKRFHWD